MGEMITCSAWMATNTTGAAQPQAATAERSQRWPAIAPGARRLVRRRCSQDRAVGVATPHDLESYGPGIVGDSGRHARRRLAREIEEIGERHPAQHRDALSCDLARGRLP